MGYRQVIIKKADKIKLKDNQLTIENENNTKVPLEDINFIVLEDPMTIITTRLLAELGKYNISLLICDENYEPSSLLSSFNNHYKQLEVFQNQINNHEELHNELWQTIIRYKIASEITILEITTQDEFVIEKLKVYIQEIELGDITNREGLAAKLYFRALFYNDFIRFHDDSTNHALNYGYTIIKSAIVRSLTAHGLNTYLGIHHRSKTNSYNLAFDIIEPYRAIVDYYVYNHFETLIYPLSFDSRKELIELLNEKVVINNKLCTLQYSIDIVVESYIRSLEQNKNLLLLPTINYE